MVAMSKYSKPKSRHSEMRYSVLLLVVAAVCREQLWLAAAGSSPAGRGWQTEGTLERRCMPIPHAFAMCRSMPYHNMLLPNIFGHDDLQLVMQQAAGWQPLVNIGCHDDAALFFCSLYAPVCIPEVAAANSGAVFTNSGALIRPCRSLCRLVRTHCEPLMLQYGFRWPNIVNCSQFPLDNGMCIRPRTVADRSDRTVSSHQVCEKSPNTETILDAFCRGSHAFKLSLRFVNETVLVGGKAKQFVSNDSRKVDPVFLTGPTFDCSSVVCCHSQLATGKRKYLVIASNISRTSSMQPVLITRWKKSKLFRRFGDMMRRLSCSDPDTVKSIVLPNAVLDRQLRSFRPRARPRILPKSLLQSKDCTGDVHNNRTNNAHTNNRRRRRNRRKKFRNRFGKHRNKFRRKYINYRLCVDSVTERRRNVIKTTSF